MKNHGTEIISDEAFRISLDGSSRPVTSLLRGHSPSEVHSHRDSGSSVASFSRGQQPQQQPPPSKPRKDDKFVQMLNDVRLIVHQANTVNLLASLKIS